MYKPYFIEKFSSSPSPSPSDTNPSNMDNSDLNKSDLLDQINDLNTNIESKISDLQIKDNEIKNLTTMNTNLQSDYDTLMNLKKSADDMIQAYEKRTTTEIDKSTICNSANGFITLEEHRNKMSEDGNFIPSDFVPKLDMQNMTSKLYKCNDNIRVMENSVNIINNDNKFYKQRGFWITILVLFLIGSIAVFILTSSGSDSSSSGMGEF
jgi:hypothetical protein